MLIEARIALERESCPMLQIKSIMDGDEPPAPISNTNWGGNAADTVAEEDQDGGW